MNQPRTRTGKIARLPRAIRHQLNQRLADGQPGNQLVHWLNHLPQVRQCLAEQFAGRPISEQNLSEWKAGGYLEWLNRQDTLDQARELAADADDLRSAAETAGQHRLSDHLATILAARYARLLNNWNGEVTEALEHQLRLLHALNQDIASLRRGDHYHDRLDLQRQRLEQTREKSEAELVDHFQHWTELSAVREAVCRNYQSPEDRMREYRRIFDMPDHPAGSTGDSPVPS